MLHIDVRYESLENGARIWFSDQVRETRRKLHVGYRELADGMTGVLRDFVTSFNLEGTATGDQMEACVTALEGCIQRNFDKEMNRRQEEYANVTDGQIESALGLWIHNTRN